ncbi:MAG: N-formylglutamate amidohydrolase [Rhizobiales bacterium]|nr:N-formylglutamate amidohydrolase [Hyphomicrobiales bacterium]
MSRTATASSADKPPYEIYNAKGSMRFLVLCDHASPDLPDGYGTLGLPPREFERHIAYDIGAADVARDLAGHLDCPAVLGVYSRLLIDLNRGEDDPTIIMKLSDGSIIEGNRMVDFFNNAAEFRHRVTAYHAPYHAQIAKMISGAMAAGEIPVIVSVHSFTPSWRGVPRPWETGILWDRDDRLARPLIERFRAEGVCVGDNEPYTGALQGDCMFVHGTMNGLPHVLVEIRQDLIGHPAGASVWAARYSDMLQEIARGEGVRAQRFYGSQVDASLPISAEAAEPA